MSELLSDGEVLRAFVTATIICLCLYTPNICYMIRKAIRK